MSEPRIPLLPLEEAAKAAVSVGIPEPSAAANIYRTLLHHPPLAKRVNEIVGTLMIDSEFDDRLRELIIMRIGWSHKGAYEWTHHWRIALENGVEERDLLAVRDWTAHDHWTPEQSAVLNATDEMLEHGSISATTWAKCAKLFPSTRVQLELVSTIGNWKMMSEIITSLQMPLEDGFAPWPPNGEAPA
ncbi:MAG: carboxymuconolactone decarboxylase family protein [Pseudomonadota bacterium]